MWISHHQWQAYIEVTSPFHTKSRKILKFSNGILYKSLFGIGFYIIGLDRPKALLLVFFFICFFAFSHLRKKKSKKNHPQQLIMYVRSFHSLRHTTNECNMPVYYRIDNSGTGSFVVLIQTQYYFIHLA